MVERQAASQAASQPAKKQTKCAHKHLYRCTRTHAYIHTHIQQNMAAIFWSQSKKPTTGLLVNNHVERKRLTTVCKRNICITNKHAAALSCTTNEGAICISSRVEVEEVSGKLNGIERGGTAARNQ